MDPNKPKLPLIDFAFIAEMANVLEAGLIDKPERKRDDWKHLEWTEELQFEYECALWRHYADSKNTESPKEAKMHLAAIAVNAMILSHYKDGGAYYVESEEGTACPPELLFADMRPFAEQITMKVIPNTPIAPKGYFRNSTPGRGENWHYFDMKTSAICGREVIFPTDKHWEHLLKSELITTQGYPICPTCASKLDMPKPEKGGTENGE